MGDIKFQMECGGKKREEQCVCLRPGGNHRRKGLYIKISELRKTSGELFSFKEARYRDVSAELLDIVSYLAVGGVWS